MAESKFSKMNQELEEIVQRLQSNDIDIDELINKYKRGIDLIGKLEKELSEAENQIKKLKPNLKKYKK